MSIRRTENYEFNRSKWSVRKRTTVFVEGPTDKELWKRFFPPIHCRIERVDGKTKVKSLLRSSQERNERGIAGIVDADYWLIRESDKLHQENLLYDKCYPNAELMILNSANSAALTDVLKTKFHSNSKDDPDIQKLADLLQTEAERLAMEFGYFRLLNDCKCYRISFKKFWKSRGYDFEEFVDVTDVESVQFRRECFAKRLAGFHNAWKSLGHCNRIEHGELLEGVAKLKEIEIYQTPNVQLCQGHDTVALIAYLLPIMFKSVFGHNLPSGFKEFCHCLKLEKQLRNKYREEDFIATTLCDSIRNWECHNDGYKILKPEL